jgi:hypothetical protein
MRLSLLRSITVPDNAPDIVDTVDELRQELYYAAPKEQIANLVERLEGWWFGRVIAAMVNKLSIPVLAIDQRVDELREQFKRNALPVDFKSTFPSPDVIAELDSRPFVRQLRRIQIGGSRIEYSSELPHRSTTIPSLKRAICMPLALTFLPVAGIPMSGPLCVPVIV